MNNEQALRNAQQYKAEEKIMSQELKHREKAFSDAMIEIKKLAARTIATGSRLEMIMDQSTFSTLTGRQLLMR